MSTIDAAIQSKITEFVAELHVLIRDAAMSAVTDALGVTTASLAPAAEKLIPAGRVPKIGANYVPIAKGAATAKRAAPAKPSARTKGTGKKRVRRTEAQLVRDVARVLAHVEAHRGATAIEIGTALNLTTDKLMGPMQRLLATKKVRREGERSGTRYFAV